MGIYCPEFLKERPLEYLHTLPRADLLRTREGLSGHGVGHAEKVSRLNDGNIL